MSQATKQQISSARAILRPLKPLQLSIKLIDCPEHPGQHQATLHCFPDKFAGIWECPITGTSDSHEHTDYEIETSTANCMCNGEPDQYEVELYVCSECGVVVDDAN